MAEKMR
jgi:4-hydroxy-2-oxoheptanedioate aldolase